MLHLDEIVQCGGCTTLLHNPFAAAHGYNCLDARKRNSNGNADASKGSTDASKSEVYNTDERARFQAHAMLHVDEIAQCGGCTTLLLPLMGRYRVDGAR